MSEKDKNILGTFLLARHIEELTTNEILDVQQAIKRVWNSIDKLKEYIEKNTAIFKNGNMLVDMNIDELSNILGGNE